MVDLEGGFPWLGSERKAGRNSGRIYLLHGLLLIQIWTWEDLGVGRGPSRGTKFSRDYTETPVFSEIPTDFRLQSTTDLHLMHII